MSSIELHTNHSVALQDIYSDIRVVQLGTCEKSLIGRIRKIKYLNNNYYILDFQKQRVLSFDEDGNFNHQIGFQGNGPEEFFYATDFCIDEYTQQLHILSPSVQQVTSYNLEGVFINKFSIESDEILAINEIYALNDSLLLFVSVRDFQIIITDRKGIIVKKLFQQDDLGPHSPFGTTYHFQGETYVLPALSTQIENLSKPELAAHYSLCFGGLNNSRKQISNLLNQVKNSSPGSYLTLNASLSENKILNHHIIRVMESNRFLILLVGIEDKVKHVFIDKKKNEHFAFDFFTGKIVINPNYEVSGDNRLITYETRDYGHILDRAKSHFGSWFYFYDSKFYDYNSLTPECKKIIDSHNPETDNPFLVVYTFKD